MSRWFDRLRSLFTGSRKPQPPQRPAATPPTVPKKTVRRPSPDTVVVRDEILQRFPQRLDPSDLAESGDTAGQPAEATLVEVDTAPPPAQAPPRPPQPAPVEEDVVEEEAAETVASPPEPQVVADLEVPRLAPAKPPTRLVRRGKPRERRLTVGLDFGTSSTKCIVNIEGTGPLDQRFLAIRYKEAGKNDDDMLFPSSAITRDGQFLFGYKAERKHTRSHPAVRSFKMCLPCLSDGEEGEEHHCPRCLADAPGHYEMGGRRIDAEDLTTLYLAYVIRHATDAAKQHLNVDQLRVHVNSAAPLDQMMEGRLRETFERCVHYAVKLHRHARNPWPIDEALKLLGEVQSTPMPAREEASTTIVPETQAVMTGYILSPTTKKGLYATVDVGAGTTDVAVFWLGHEDNNPAVKHAYYYAAYSEFVGMDDVDRVIAGNRANPRKTRQGLSPAELFQRRAGYQHILDRMFTHYRKTWGLAYDMQRHQRYWVDADGHAKYKLCLVGGGAMFEPANRRLRDAVYHFFESTDVIEPTLPDAVECIDTHGGLDELDDSDNGQVGLMLLAYGLAQRAVDIPQWSKQKQPFEYELKKIAHLTHEELYAR